MAVGWLLGPVRTAVGDDPLAGRIAAIVSGVKAGSMRVGVRVLELPSGRVVYEHHATDAFKPASNMKLVTSAAALELLPADYRFRTTLAVRGDDLIVLGTGDPTLGDPKLAAAKKEPITALFDGWADKLIAAGVREVRGDLILDDTEFEAERFHPNWPENQRDKWYSAPVGALNFNDNCIEVEVRPGAKAGSPAELSPVPPNTYVVLRNQTRTSNKQTVTIRRDGDQPVYIVSGTVSRAGTLSSVAVPDPGMLFGSAMRTALAAKGIRIAGDIRRARVRDDRGSLPASCKVIDVHETELRDVLTRLNKNSQNLFAGCLLKATAFELSRRDRGVGEGSYAAARVYVGAFLAKLGAAPSEYVVDDGSGLSAGNRVSPRLITELLRTMDRHARRDEFVDSLSIAGTDGTLEKRLRDVRGQVRAKTGYIAGVSSLSGYAESKSGQRYCFSVLCNDFSGSSAPARKLQDDIARALVTADAAKR